MRCKYCNVLLEEYDKGICRYCGKDNHVVGQIIESDSHQHIKSVDYINPNDSMTNELIKHYIGSNYDSIARGGFSIPCLFFGIGYLAYRKFWRLFILVLFGYIFLPFLFFPATLIVNIGLGIKFKQEYLKYVKETVINLRKQNQNASFEDLKQQCQMRGGVNKYLLVILAIIIISFIYFIFNFTIEGYTIVEIIENTIENYKA